MPAKNFPEQGDVVMTHEVHIRRGVLINDDPQRRCYDGCYFASHMEWGKWEHWMDYPSEEDAKRAKRLFARETQQLKVVPKQILHQVDSAKNSAQL